MTRGSPRVTIGWPRPPWVWNPGPAVVGGGKGHLGCGIRVLQWGWGDKGHDAWRDIYDDPPSRYLPPTLLSYTFLRPLRRTAGGFNSDSGSSEG